MPDPSHAEGQAVFVASFGNEIEEVIRTNENIQAPRVTRIGVKDFSRRVPGEDTGSRSFFAGKIALGVVVFDVPADSRLRRERYVIVEVEIAAEGRDPLKLPTHALLEGFNLDQRRTRNHHEHRIAIGEVDGCAVEMVRQVGAAWTPCLPAGTEHEVIHDELTAAVEQIDQGHFSVRGIEFVPLLHLFPRQSAPLAAQRIAQASKFLLFVQKLFARRKPFRMRDDGWVNCVECAASHDDPPWLG